MDCYLFFFFTKFVDLIASSCGFQGYQDRMSMGRTLPHLWLWNLSFLGLCSKSSQFYSFSWECFNTQSNFTQFSSALGNQFLWTLRSVLHLSDKSSHLLSCMNGNPSRALSLQGFNTATQIHKTAFTRHKWGPNPVLLLLVLNLPSSEGLGFFTPRDGCLASTCVPNGCVS